MSGSVKRKADFAWHFDRIHPKVSPKFRKHIGMAMRGRTRNKWSMDQATDGKYFTFVRKEGNGKIVTTCHYCSKNIRVSQNKICNLLVHLQAMHAQHYDDFRAHCSVTSLPFDAEDVDVDDGVDDGNGDDMNVKVCLAVLILKLERE